MWNIKSGELANKENYPVLNEFKIPVSNDQTINQLLCKLIKLKSEKSNGITNFNITEKNSTDSMYLQIPIGTGRDGATAVGNVAKMITNARKDGEKEDCARIILNALEKEYEEAFFRFVWILVIQHRGHHKYVQIFG